MKTKNEFSEGQLKAIALKQFNNEDFFVVDGDDSGEDVKIFEGNEEEAREGFRADIEGTEEAEIEANFLIYCQNNLTEVEPIDADEERDGYIVLTDEEADKKAKEYIIDTLWAFNANFLAGETGIDEEVFKAIQDNGRCESNNTAIERLIDDIDSFVESAISADGRGHFMSSYDGNENEEVIEGERFYIYRIN